MQVICSTSYSIFGAIHGDVKLNRIKICKIIENIIKIQSKAHSLNQHEEKLYCLLLIDKQTKAPLVFQNSQVACNLC